MLSLFEEKQEGVVCPNCFGKGSVVIPAKPDRRPDPMDTTVPCPICHGTGNVPHYVRKRDEI